MEKLLQTAHSWLKEYISTFYATSDQEVIAGIQLKELHTEYVTKNCRALAEHLQLSKHDQELSELIGLLHDVGRFRQWSLYKTFRDNLSEDHAELGIKVIQELPFLASLTTEEKELLLFAVANHNKKAIAPAPSPKHLLLAKLIRDADKLDIYRVNLEKVCQASDIGFSPKCKANFIAGQQISAADFRSMDDLKLIYLLWPYDIYFSWTMQRIWERGYIQAIIASLPVDKEAEVGVTRMLACIHSKLQEKDI